jgi:hypothetical protein
MRATETKQELHTSKHLKKKQRSKHPTDIGTPQVPLRQLPAKQGRELLCNWENAS